MTNFTSFSRRSFLVMPLALAACYGKSQIIDLSGFSMGTGYNVVAIDHNNTVDEAIVHKAVMAALAEINSSMSNWDDSSELSQFNASSSGQMAQLSPELAEVMQAAAQVSRASDGRFDTTMGPLIELWGFGVPGMMRKPGDIEIDEALARSGHQNTLSIGDRQMAKTQPDATVYLAGIGKGYGADHVGRALEALGIKHYLVEIGGDLYASGLNPDGMPWQIGVESPSPMAQGVLGVVGVSGLGLASSGDYRNYFEADGTRYSHLIDPATGRPVAHDTASATVLAENAMMADAWSTAMLILGREHGLEVAARHNIAVQFIDRNSSTAQTAYTTHTSEAFATLTA